MLGWSWKAWISWRVSSAAPSGLQPLAFWPDHSGVKSVLPRASAAARSGAMAAAASGKAGTASRSGPSSRIKRLTMPRAGRPVNRLVSAVWRAPSPCSAARCKALVVASGHSR